MIRQNQESKGFNAVCKYLKLFNCSSLDSGMCIIITFGNKNQAELENLVYRSLTLSPVCLVGATGVSCLFSLFPVFPLFSLVPIITTIRFDKTLYVFTVYVTGRFYPSCAETCFTRSPVRRDTLLGIVTGKLERG